MILLLIAVGLLFLGALAVAGWRSRNRTAEVSRAQSISKRAVETMRETPGTPGVKPRGGASARDRGNSANAVPIPHPPADDSRIKVAAAASGADRIEPMLTILSASRSVMTVTLDVRLKLNNRSAAAARSVSVSALFTSANPADPPRDAAREPDRIASIERIGPNQSHTIEATLSLPLNQVRAIRQGKTPLLVPLIHLDIASRAAGERARRVSFVIGTPSKSNEARLHPIALDAPVGSIHGLRANAIAGAATGEAA